MLTIMASIKTQAAPPNRATEVYPLVKLDARRKTSAAKSEMAV
jgi:hypothetical protein